MLEALLSVIVDIILSAIGSAIVKVLGLENAVEIVAAILGLGFIVIGVTTYLFGH